MRSTCGWKRWCGAIVWVFPTEVGEVPGFWRGEVIACKRKEKGLAIDSARRRYMSLTKISWMRRVHYFVRLLVRKKDYERGGLSCSWITLRQTLQRDIIWVTLKVAEFEFYSRPELCLEQKKKHWRRMDRKLKTCSGNNEWGPVKLNIAKVTISDSRWQILNDRCLLGMPATLRY